MFAHSSSSLRLLHVLLLLVVLLGIAGSEQGFWKRYNDLELEEALRTHLNTGVAKNVILFVGDGMGPNTVTATRIYSSGEMGTLGFERFPHIGLLKTYSANKQVAESSSTATALMCGEKVNAGTLGVSSRVKSGDCAASLEPENQLQSIAYWGQEAGKSAGIISTMRITHATPAGMYARSASRLWECENKMPKNASACKDIARQLVEDRPGRDFKVILGGGRQVMMAKPRSLPNDPLDEGLLICQRRDGRDLIRDWKDDKERRNASYKYVTNSGELLDMDYSKTEYLLGLFANSHMQYENNRDKSPKGPPSLQQMTEAAIKTLVKNDKGFILMVEGGLIDHAHHKALARTSLEETVELSKAVDSAVNLLKQLNMLDETLILVTSDHSHTLTINGYPELGNNILGVAGASPADGINFTTLSYGVVAPAGYRYESKEGRVVREDPSSADTTSYNYRFQGSIPSNKNHHGGSDVLVYAKGPMAHLMHRIHEQTYVAKVITYAARIGPDSNARAPGRSSGTAVHSTFSVTVIINLVLAFAKLA